MSNSYFKLTVAPPYYSKRNRTESAPPKLLCCNSFTAHGGS